MNREKEIIKASGIGIASNMLLAGFKAGVGVLSGSIAIVLDAVNNLSDALSSIITIIGAKLASRRPTRNHPLGFGRIEYISATIVALIVLMAGIGAFETSIKTLLNGNETHYDWTAFLIIVVAIVVKLLLGRYTKSVGERVQSISLVASGVDATFDAVVTFSTLVSALIMIIWNINIDGWLGMVISLVIIKAGIDLIRETMNDLLGNRMSSEMTQKLKNLIKEYPNVHGAYDMILHNYGPEFTIGSVNIEVPDDMKACDIYKLTRRMQNDILAKEGVYLFFSIYARRDDDNTIQKRKSIIQALKDEKDIIQMHAFYVEEATKTISFDVVSSFDVKDLDEFGQRLKEKSQAAVSGYNIVIQLEYDFSD